MEPEKVKIGENLEKVFGKGNQGKAKNGKGGMSFYASKGSTEKSKGKGKGKKSFSRKGKGKGKGARFLKCFFVIK